eukprot:9479685-Heterocapsa_arctica.AAC.1
MHHDNDKLDEDQARRYVHEGLLQIIIQGEANIVEIELDAEKGEHSQHIAGEDQEKESSTETQEHKQHTAEHKQDEVLDFETQGEKQFELTQTTEGEQNEHNAQDSEINQIL